MQGREITKFICFCVRSYYLCHYEYRKQIENAISVCLCTYLSLSLQYARISRVGYEKMRLVLSDSFFTLHAQRAKYRYNMDIIWIIVGAICLLVGLAGCFLPALPGPPLSYVGMILLHLTDKVQFTATQLIVWAILVIIVQVLDYLTPLIGTKYSGGSKWGNRGCIAGTVIGIFLFPPWGIIFGPLVGAVIGELLGGKLTHEALKAGLGAFVGFLLGVILKVSLCGYFVVVFISALF